MTPGAPEELDCLGEVAEVDEDTELDENKRRDDHAQSAEKEVWENCVGRALS